MHHPAPLGDRVATLTSLYSFLPYPPLPSFFSLIRSSSSSVRWIRDKMRMTDLSRLGRHILLYRCSFFSSFQIFGYPPFPLTFQFSLWDQSLDWSDLTGINQALCGFDVRPGFPSFLWKTTPPFACPPPHSLFPSFSLAYCRRIKYRR
ncbi:hypothetical protein NPIL_375521 [Nephila pilipes]|uniref:Uncharacterized protein n=1 Tax=Nephila pilipes TaxID=299642 RepID=A0A8X6MVJ1_NEPPI|nr:hypothetical protein NPIL_375521 [Nephila pilipes]